MKKYLHILLCTLTLCTFIGCSSNEPTQPKDYFTLWNQCEALTALQTYVEDVTHLRQQRRENRIHILESLCEDMAV